MEKPYKVITKTYIHSGNSFIGYIGFIEEHSAHKSKAAAFKEARHVRHQHRLEDNFYCWVEENGKEIVEVRRRDINGKWRVV